MYRRYRQFVERAMAGVISTDLSEVEHQSCLGMMDGTLPDLKPGVDVDFGAQRIRAAGFGLHPSMPRHNWCPLWAKPDL